MRVLEITSELDGGGVDRLLYDYCSRMIEDIQFDFVVTSKSEGILEQPLKDLGCKIYRVPQIKEGFKNHTNEIKKILQENNYDVVHDHSGYKAWCNLSVAKKCGVENRIAHAHQAFMAETYKQRILRIISTPVTKIYATELFACGNDAAKWMWGKSAFENNKVFIMKNAIDAKKFTFDSEKRKKLRKELMLEDNFVVGNVARFSYQKNQEFLIDVFLKIKKYKDNAVLLLVGRGETENAIKQRAEELGLSESVLFLGVRNDVQDLLNVMDVFVLPSRFEGLPVTLVEIQANGLPAVVSDVVTKEMSVSDSITFLSLLQSADEWAKVVSDKERADSKNLIEKTEYDLCVAADEMYKKYLSMIKVK